MSRSTIILLILLSFSSICTSQDATEIIRKSEEKIRGEKSAYAETTIDIVRPKWSREMSLRSWSKGETYSMILVTAPAREEGTTFLKRGNEVWNWVPSIERTIKLPPSMMTQSWMGTDFTNDDLVRESSYINDYNHQLAGDSTINGRECYKIRLTPKENAAVVWGELIVFIDKEQFIQLRVEMYDEDNFLVNIMTMSGVREMDGRIIATKMELQPVDKPGQKTIMRVDDIKFDIPIEDSFFSTKNMRKIK